jgi:hypothetical protein
MSYIISSEFKLEQVSAPNLPRAPIEYSPQYQEQLNNVMRLYFNRLNNLFTQFGAGGEIIPALTVYTVATLPSASVSGVGARSFVSDATVTTFASTVAGGGANKVPVYSDGTDWKIG